MSIVKNNRKNGRRVWLRKLKLCAASIVVSLLAAEIALRLLTPLPRPALSNRIPDPRLEYRMDPALAEIDQHGFRNPDGIDRADIVAIGDSHTYGYNVNREESWPAQLGQMTGLTVYNLGVGGFGVLQYHDLFQEAFARRPRHVILALYLANDLDEVGQLISRMPAWREWAEQRGHDTSSCIEASPEEKRPIRWLAVRTAIGSLLIEAARPVRRRLAESVVVDVTRSPTRIAMARIDRHRRSMDMQRPQMRLGLAITKDVLREAKGKADAEGIGLSVLLVPSKERVFYEDLVAAERDLPQAYHDLVTHEAEVRGEVSEFLRKLDIPYVDSIPYLMRKMRAEGGVYTSYDDGHPLEAGYEAYAEAAAERRSNCSATR